MNVAIITARGNNQSIKDKNLIDIHGKSSLGYVIESAQNARLIDDVYITTDCEKIKSLGLGYGCKIIDRPPELSLPDTNHGVVIAHAVEAIKPQPDIVTILLGNTVMGNSKLIDMSVRILGKNLAFDSVMSVWKAADDHPYRALKLNEGFLESYSDGEFNTARQSYPDVYFYDQGVWTFRYDCIDQKGSVGCWWWMGKKCFPIIRNWVTGRDFHSQLDVKISEFWIENNLEDEIVNLQEIEGLVGNKAVSM